MPTSASPPLQQALLQLPLFKGLSPAQREAVFHRSAKQVVLAGAGAGKTRVLVARMAWMLWGEPQLPANNILAITFTRKACGEMRERLQAVQRALGDNNPLPPIDTFHATALKILRSSPLGHLQIIEDALPLLQAFIKEDSRSESLGVGATELLADLERGRSDRLSQKALAQLAKRFRQYKLKRQQVVLSDLVPLALEQLKYKDLQQKWAGQLQALLVDEFQDVNDQQMALFRALIGRGSHFSLFGDDDQAIYGWRGSNPDCLRALTRQKDTSVCFLPVNYRCAPPILALSEAIIQQDDSRLSKEIQAGRKGGELPRCLIHKVPAIAVVNEVLRQLRRGRSLSELCVLVRDHASANTIRRALDRANIAHGDDHIRIQTFHSSKGLEFPVVLLPFFDEGRFPSNKGQAQRNIKHQKSAQSVRPTIKVHHILIKRRKKAIKDLYRVLKMAYLPAPRHQIKKPAGHSWWRELANYIDYYWQLWRNSDIERSLIARERAVTAVQRTIDVYQPKIEKAKAFKEAEKSFKNEVQEALREERRLCYVAITRAQDECIFVSSDLNRASSFLKSVPKGLLRWEKDKDEPPLNTAPPKQKAPSAS